MYTNVGSRTKKLLVSKYACHLRKNILVLHKITAYWTQTS